MPMDSDRSTNGRKQSKTWEERVKRASKDVLCGSTGELCRGQRGMEEEVQGEGSLTPIRVR